jgi:hypothetical protein
VPDPASLEFLALQQALAGRYSLEREIGRGGMGVVFLARDVALDRPVAIKLLPPSMAGDVELRDRFLREARTAAQLSHPNIVPIHLVEERDGSIYFVMALVEGESLGERVRRVGPLPPMEIVRIVQEVAWALAYAHGRGVVHRDVKPDNILLERGSGRALLTDFGIARSVTASTSATLPGMILGTLQYIAPEQADGTVPVDGRADLYALGVTAFYALAGRLPFEATAGAQLLAAHLLEPAPPLASISSTIDARIGEVVDRCLVKDPGARWQTGEELASALASLNQKSRPMPPSVRRFVTTVSGAMGQLALLWLAMTWSYIIVPDQYPLIAKLLALVAIAPIIPILDAARAVAIAGYTVDDVVDSVRADKAASDAYTQYVKRSVEQTNKTMKGPLARVMFGLAGVFLILLAVILVDIRTVAPLGKAIARVVLGLLTGWMGVEFLGHGLQLRGFKSRLMRFMERQATRDVTTRLWGSWPVRAVLAIGRKLLWTIPGIKTPSRTTVAENRPTEVMLAAAAEEIFIGLSDADRAIVADVPRVIRQMQGAAADFRRRQTALNEAIASVGDVAGNTKRAEVLAEMEAERADVAVRLRSTVEAMENLRLDLLKLRAGVGNAGALTAAIAAGKRVSEGIDYTIAGREEASRVVR